MITAHSSRPPNQSTMHQLSHSRSTHSFRHETSNTPDLLPTWTPLPVVGKTSKKELELEENNTDTLEVDELAFNDDIHTPVKKRRISSYSSTQPRVRTAKISPGRARRVDTKASKPQSGRSTEFQPLDNEAFSMVGPSRADRRPSSSGDVEASQWRGPATESNIFVESDGVEAVRLNYTRNTSSIVQDEEPSLKSQPTTSDVEAPGGPRIRNRFSRPTVVPTNPSAPISKHISSSTSPSHTLAGYPKRRRRQAQPQWERPKATKGRAVVVPTREVNAAELEVLTNASVSPVVFLRTRYAASPRDEQREAAMRWNLRWVSGSFENSSGKDKTREEGILKRLLDNEDPNPVAVPEMTRSQRRDFIIDSIYAKEEEVRSTSSEQ